MKPPAHTYDAAVIGGGPSGATAAYLLARQGYRVALIDKSTFPRPKLCAGLITRKTVDLLNSVFGYSARQLMKRGIIIHKSRDYRIYIHGQEIARRRLDYPFHFVNRNSYDHFWVQKAQAAGAEPITGCKVVSVNTGTGTVALEDGTLFGADTIIGADGVWSVVRRALYTGQRFNQRWQANLAMTIETKVPSTDGTAGGGFASLHFGHVPWGYGWCFPNPGSQIVGVGALGDKRDASLAKDFRRFIHSLGRTPDGMERWQSFALPFGNYVDPPAVGRTLLVGDACGLADPLLGEGIYYAHRSGQLAAQAVASAELHGQDPAIHYRRSLNKHLLRELRWIKFYRNLLFYGGRRRRYRGLKLFFRLMPGRLEDTVQGKISFSHLLLPWFSDR
jgi:geranylgeranyl reductase family protein